MHLLNYFVNIIDRLSLCPPKHTHTHRENPAIKNVFLDLHPSYYFQIFNFYPQLWDNMLDVLDIDQYGLNSPWGPSPFITILSSKPHKDLVRSFHLSLKLLNLFIQWFEMWINSIGMVSATTRSFGGISAQAKIFWDGESAEPCGFTSIDAIQFKRKTKIRSLYDQLKQRFKYKGR